MSDVVEAMNRFVDAVNGTRDWRNDPCELCGRRAGESCDIDFHAEFERAHPATPPATPSRAPAANGREPHE